MTSSSLATRRHYWFRPEDCRLEDFRAVVEQATDPADYPYADSVEENVVVYGSRVREHTASLAQRREVQAELVRALLDGPGIVVFREAFPDRSTVDRASEVFTALIAEQKAKRRGRRRPLREARSERPRLGSAGQVRAARRRCSPTTTPTTCSPWSARPGSARATRSRPRST